MFKDMALLTVLLTISVGASAGPIYRCEGPDGSTVIKDKPCRGKEKSVPVLSGKVGISTIVRQRSVFSQLNTLHSLRPKPRPSSANKPVYRSSTTCRKRL